MAQHLDKKKDITDAGSCEMQAFVSNFLAKNDTKRLKSHFNISKMIKGLLSKYIFKTRRCMYQTDL